MCHFCVLIGKYNFVDLPPAAASLASQASTRAWNGFRPVTQSSYLRMFKLFISFCICVNVNLSAISASVILAFLEFLVQNQISHSSIPNYVSSVRSMMSFYGLNNSAFDHFQVKMFLRSTKINRPLLLSTTAIINIPLLSRIVAACDTMYMGQVYKAVYLVAFFSFLRISNLAPHKASEFDQSRQLAKGDVFFYTGGAKLLIKWSKTLQTRDKLVFIHLPDLGASPLCPVTALKMLKAIVPGSSTSPLFQIKVKKLWVPLTDSRIRGHFAMVQEKLGIKNRGFSFHSFRRSGASFAFNNNVRIQDIQAHGTWTSDCVWRYICQDSSRSSQVQLSFKQALFSPLSTPSLGLGSVK